MAKKPPTFEEPDPPQDYVCPNCEGCMVEHPAIENLWECRDCGYEEHR